MTMTTETEAAYETDVTPSVPEPSREVEQPPLFPSLDGEQSLLSPLWRDAELLG